MTFTLVNGAGDPKSTELQQEKATAAQPNVVDGKVKPMIGHGKAVDDDYMYELEASRELPTTNVTGKAFDKSTDATAVAEAFIKSFAEATAAADADKTAGLFWEHGVWRDKVAITWEYRSFNGTEAIHKMCSDLLSETKITNVTLLTPPAPKLETPYDDLSYVQVHIKFDTAIVGASAVVNLVNTSSGVKIWTFHSAIESLHQFPELHNRDGHMIGPHSWGTQRAMDVSFEESEPEVLIIGGGHNGLMMAARCQALGIKTLIIERNERIGDNWRQRYEALSLHFPHYADHLPYMPYPGHWPIYTPAAKLGDWLEAYYNALELKAWTNSQVETCEQDLETHEWTVTIERGGYGQRTVRPKHVVMATSLAGVPMLPTIDGMDEFGGVIRHSTAHDSSRTWVGKKVLVVGTSSSGMDCAFDFARRGVDVTLLQRSPTYIMSLTNSVPKIIGNYIPGLNTLPIEANDRIAYSMPTAPAEPLSRRMTQQLCDEDRPLLDGMEKAGFKCYQGQRGTGTNTLGLTRNGGFYFEAGACEYVINGKIKVEQGYINHFTKDKVVLNDNRERDFDLVIMATGFSNTIDSIRRTLGSHISERVGEIWGVDKEGELKGAWKSTGVPNLWVMVGTLQHGRYHSQKVSLRIKAMLEGIAPKAYTA